MIKKTIRTYYKSILRRYILPFLGYLLAQYIKLVYKTSSVTIIQNTEVDVLMAQGQSAIYAFWHGQLLMMPALNAPHEKMMVLSSKNEIRLLTDRLVGEFGIVPIHGSRQNPKKPNLDKGGVRALKQIILHLKNGYSIGITPDGPLGPRHKVHKGIIIAAILSQKPIIPIIYVGSSGYYAKRWDRFFIPRPFSKIYYHYGTPIYVPRDTKEGAVNFYADKLETIMNNMLRDLNEKITVK